MMAATLTLRPTTNADVPALALKPAALQLAGEMGIREVWTSNASTKLPMLALHERLGFRPRPAFIEMCWGGV